MLCYSIKDWEIHTSSISDLCCANGEEQLHTGAQILEATDSMLSDITGNEKYASDISGLHVSTDNIDDILAEDAPAKVCPECQNPVPAGDVFCHACGAYVG